MFREKNFNDLIHCPPGEISFAGINDPYVQNPAVSYIKMEFKIFLRNKLLQAIGKVAHRSNDLGIIPVMIS